MNAQAAQEISKNREMELKCFRRVPYSLQLMNELITRREKTDVQEDNSTKK